MAYGLKYNFTCRTNVSNELVQCKVYEDDFVGSVRTFSAGWGPRDCVIVATDNTELDPMFPIRSKAATLNLFINCLDDAGNAFTESNLTAIMFSNDRQFKLEILVGSTTMFLGWFTPQQSVSFSAYKFGSIKLVFTDGLAQLKSIKYQVPGVYNYEVSRFRTIVTNCLAETGLNLDIRYSNTLYYDSATALLIDKLGIETTALRNSVGTEGLDCYQILETLMRSIACTLFQRDGKWRIESFVDKSQSTEKYATILYTDPTASLSLSTGTFSTLPLLSDTRKTVDRSLVVNVFRPRSEVNGTAPFTDHTHWAANYLFRTFTGIVPNRWTPIDMTTRKANGGASNGVEIQGFQNGSVNVGDALVSTDYPVKKGARLLIDWDFDVLIPIESPVGRVQISISVTGGGVKYLDTDGTWSATEVWLQGQQNDFESIVVVNDDGVLSARLGKPFVPNSGASQTDYYVVCKFLDITILNGRKNSEDINTDYDAVVLRATTGRKFIFKDEEQLHLGHNFGELPALGVDLLKDYFVTVHKDPVTFDDLGALVDSDELLTSSGTLLASVASLRAMLYASNFVFAEGQFVGDFMDVFNIYTETILGSTRRLVVISNEMNLKTQQQTVILAESKLAAQNTITTDLNFK